MKYIVYEYIAPYLFNPSKYDRYELKNDKELKGNTATFLLSKVFKDWELEKEEDVKLNNDETVEEVSIRDHLSLKSANQTAILLAYQKAGKKVKIKATHPYIFYLEKKESDVVRIGDEIVKV